MSKARILIVEDETIVAFDLQERLQQLGYEVIGISTNGDDAIRKALDLQPDLIMMDIKLRGQMDGIQVAHAIREQMEVPVIYLTAFADEETILRAQFSGPYGYVLKPFDEKQLSINIDMALHIHNLDQQPPRPKNKRDNGYSYTTG